MSLIHGENISAGNIERTVSSWDAERFARLCNAIAWAVAWPTAQAMPAFTERILVRDNGIDAEWTGEIAPDAVVAGQLLRVGTNVFQYKKREIVEESRAGIVSTLTSELKGAIADVERRTGKVLATYVLFINVDLTVAQHEQLSRAIRKEASERPINVEVIGAAALAAMLNNLPHLRSAFFSTLNFQTWAESWQAHCRASPFAQTPLIGRVTICEALTTLLRDQAVKVIAIIGTHMMGKSRAVLEATRACDVEFVEALERQGPQLVDLMRLTSPGRTVVVLANDLDPWVARELAAGVLARDGLKLVLCLSTEESTPKPNFGLNEHVRQLSLPPLADDDSRKLLSAAGAKLDYSLESWIIDNSGGVPGVLLAAASLGDRLRTDGGRFLEQIAIAFETQLQSRLSAREFQTARAIALLSHIGVRGDPGAEAALVCEQFGLEINTLLNVVNRLVAGGFARLEGSYAEVVPPPLANRLVSHLLRGSTAELAACFSAFDEAAKRRLLRRLIQVRGDEVSAFWDGLFAVDGPFSSLEGISGNSELFRFAAAVNGRRAGILLRRELTAQTVERRRQIAGRTRRNFVHAIEEMLFRGEASEDAFWCMALLAEAENEQWSNNSSGILKEVFGPLHPQVPMRLDRRLLVLTDMISRRSSCVISTLAAEAIGDMLDFVSSTTLRHSFTATPLGRIPTMSWRDVWDYTTKALELLAGASEDTRNAVRKAACQRLPHAIANVIARQHPAGIALFETLVNRVLAGDHGFSVSQLADSIRWCRFALRGSLQTESQPNEATIQQLTHRHDRLQYGDFPTRMRFWLGGWYHDLEASDRPMDTAYRAIADLAEEVVADHELLDAGTLHWLIEDADRGMSFWLEVGRYDTPGVLQDLVAVFGESEKPAFAFSSYLTGWRKRDSVGSAHFFDSLVRTGRLCPGAMFHGTLASDAADDAADRIVSLMGNGTVKPGYVLAVLSTSSWLAEVSEGKLVEVLEAIAAPDLENAGKIPQLLDFRSHIVAQGTGSLTEFAWRCLEVHPTIDAQDDYYFDRIAGELALRDLDRAFALLTRCLTDTRPGRRWNPVGSSLPHNTFWIAVRGMDRARALVEVLEAIRLESANGYEAICHLPNLVDMAADAPTLLNYAAQSEECALIVCMAIVGGEEAFWPIAFRLVELYPGGQVERALSLRIQRIGQAIWGPYSELCRECIAEIEAAMQRPDIPAHATRWLDGLVGGFREALQEQLRREADGRVDRG